MNKFSVVVLAIASIGFALPSVASTRDAIVDEHTITEHRTTINGERVRYTAEVGTQPVWDENGMPTATLFYTYYKRTDAGPSESRPLLISFNGGPGSASVWMHVAYTGPMILNIDDEGYPVQPYGVRQNPYSVLDVADIVFVNPVNTGFSRVLPGADGNLPSRAQQGDMFFGVNEDIAYLGEWIDNFVSRHQRWRSPKFLIGESYGTTRVSGLALELQNSQWMYLNGVILVSPTDIGIDREGPVKAANRLPYFAATAWYHGQLESRYQSMPLLQFLAEVEGFTIDEYLPALARGASLSDEMKVEIANSIARYTGLTSAEILQSNLDIPNSYFWKALLRDEGFTVGRLDSRYKGIDLRDTGDSPDYWAELTSWLHSFTPAINYYLRDVLGYDTELQYNMFGPVHPWNREGNNTGENLRLAMAQNPYLNVLIQAGYYDGATNYFDAKYTMWQLDRSGRMSDRIEFEGYESGHMMYLRRPDLESSNQHLREFIQRSLPAEGESAQYN